MTNPLFILVFLECGGWTPLWIGAASQDPKQADSVSGHFLECGGWTPLWMGAASQNPKRRPAAAFQDLSLETKFCAEEDPLRSKLGP